MTPSDSPTATVAKGALRRAAIARRDALPADVRAAADRAITARVVPLIVARIPTGVCVGLFASKGSEIDTAALDAALRAAGFAIAYPRVVAHTRALAFHVTAPDALVTHGTFGLREPADAAPAIAVADVAAFLLPGLAFDRAGNRLGWGRGHYDATLAASSALRIGLAYEAQLVDAVPTEPHDVPLALVITERAAYPAS